MSDSETSSAKRGRILGKGSDKWLIFAGDCDAVNEYLREKSDKSAFIVFQYVNSLLRSFGYVIFANNPVSGLIILASILSADHLAGFAAILCSTLSFLFAALLRQDFLGNLNGFFGYNAVLLGTFSTGLLPHLYSAVSVDEAKFWLFLIFATLMSVYVTSALANLFRYLGQHPVPCFLLPFNVLLYILIFCLLNNSVPPTIISRHLLQARTTGNGTATEVASIGDVSTALPFDPSLYTEANAKKRKRNEGQTTTTTTTTPDVFLAENHTLETASKNESAWNWGGVFSGTVVSISQIYGLNSVPGSVFMFLALMIYSPTTTLFCYAGSLLATLFGTTFASNHEEVYHGLWGYNGLLCGGALAGFGFVLTPRSAALALTAILFSTVLQHYLTPLFLWFDVPILTIPFNVTAILFLFVTSDSEKALPRPGNLSFPEKHRHDFKEGLKAEMEGYLRRPRVSETHASKYDA